MVEANNNANEVAMTEIKEKLATMVKDPSQNIDDLCNETIKLVLAHFSGSRSKLLIKLLTEEIKPAKAFEIEPQPQDTGDLLAEVISLFLNEANEISDVINQINKESTVLHSVKQAEAEIKVELMKIMMAKQKEIMLKYGLQAEQN